MIRVVLPQHLQNLAGVSREITLDVDPPYTQRRVIDVLESRYPPLRGTLRDHSSHKRRPFIRFFACGNDLSHESPDAPLPEAIVSGNEPFLIVGAMAGG